MKRVAIVAMGPGSSDLMTVAALRAIDEADLVVGAQRLVDGLSPDRAAVARVAVQADDIERALRENDAWQRACLMMTGDVGFFSGAKRMLARLDGFEVSVIPGVSSVQLFAARLARPWQSWRFASAHGTDCDIESIVASSAETFLVTGAENSVGALCARLVRAGAGDALVSVGERLSYPDECISRGTAAAFADRDFDPLSVMLVERPEAGGCVDCAREPRTDLWPFATHGIPDDRFKRGSAPMTKQEVRAVALAKMGIAATDVVYDVGAGTGSVAVEAARLASQGTVYAVERNAEACALIGENAERFGVGNVCVVEGSAPDALAGLPAPDCVFIGGSGGGLSRILAAVAAANPAVRVCVTCVTLETIAEASRLLASDPFVGFEACQMQASRSQTAGAYHLMKAENPVFIITARGSGATR